MRGLLAAAVLVAGCGNTAFVCSDSEQCDGGVCEANGYCSYDDDSCESGRRYGALSGEFSSQCVGPSEGASSGESDAGATTDSSTTSSGGGSTTAPDPSTSAGTTGIPATESGEVDDWWDLAWSRRQQLTIDGSQLPGDVSDVPVLIRIDAARTDVAEIAPGGEDLRFVAADQSTVLAHEVDETDSSGTIWVWLRVPQLPSGGESTVWLYYGNPAAGPNTGSGPVWDESHVAVWHLGATITDAVDGSAPEVNEAIAAAGQIGLGRQFGGVSASIVGTAVERLADLPSMGITMTAWLKATTFGGADAGRIVDKSDAIAPTLGFSWQLTGQNGYSSLQFDRGGVFEGSWIAQDDPIALEQWHFVAVTHVDPGPPTMYVDGQRYGVIEDLGWSGPPASDAMTSPYLGNRAADNREFDGVLDEIRISSSVRSDAWIAAQYLSGRDQLVTVGPVQLRP